MLTFNRPITTPLLLGNAANTAIFAFASNPTYGFGFETTGYPAPSVVVGGLTQVVFNGGVFAVGGYMIGFLSGGVGTSADVQLQRDAADTLALKRSTAAQTFRVYGTTTGSKYSSISHNGTNGFSLASAGDFTVGSSDAAGSLYLYAGTANRWQIGSGGVFGSAGNYGFTVGISALATGATAGWLQIQSCAGTPTGAPALPITGQIPMVYDTTNNKLYFYNSGWKRAQVAAVDAIYA